MSATFQMESVRGYVTNWQVSVEGGFALYSTTISPVESSKLLYGAVFAPTDQTQFLSKTLTGNTDWNIFLIASQVGITEALTTGQASFSPFIDTKIALQGTQAGLSESILSIGLGYPSPSDILSTSSALGSIPGGWSYQLAFDASTHLASFSSLLGSFSALSDFCASTGCDVLVPTESIRSTRNDGVFPSASGLSSFAYTRVSPEFGGAIGVVTDAIIQAEWRSGLSVDIQPPTGGFGSLMIAVPSLIEIGQIKASDNTILSDASHAYSVSWAASAYTTAMSSSMFIGQPDYGQIILSSIAAAPEVLVSASISGLSYIDAKFSLSADTLVVLEASTQTSLVSSDQPSSIEVNSFDLLDVPVAATWGIIAFRRFIGLAKGSATAPSRPVMPPKRATHTPSIKGAASTERGDME